MNEASKALAEVRRWLCDNLDASDAGHVCGMLSVVSRRVVQADRLESENAKLRELVRELWTYAEQELLCDENCPYGAVCDWRDCVFERRMRELGVEP